MNKSTDKNKNQLKWYEKASKKRFDENGKEIVPESRRSKKKGKQLAETAGGNGKILPVTEDVRGNRKNHSVTEAAGGRGKRNSLTDDAGGKQKRNHSTEDVRGNRKRNSVTEDTRGKQKRNPLTPQTTLFSTEKIPADALNILNTFDKLVISSRNLTSKQISLLPKQIKELSHELTDDRTSRHLGYMNKTTTVSAYIYYYMWWNLVRLVKLFANLSKESLALDDDAVCLDIGSGPLTLPIALFLARPELRTKKITWYCTDISSTALAEGENLFLTVAAKLKCEPWKIIRIKGEFGTSIKQKVSLVAAANVFNEIAEDNEMPPDYLSKKYTEKLIAYTDSAKTSRILIVEPGVPKTARFVTLLRDSLMRKNFIPAAPCTHCEQCPMDGKRGGKWCNFAFSTDDAPASLKKLSEAAHLPKERAVLSFVLAVKASVGASDVACANGTAVGACDNSSANSARADASDVACAKNARAGETGGGSADSGFVNARIASDPIHLPADIENGRPYARTGYYACSSKGLLLIVTRQAMRSGEEYKIKWNEKNISVDKKTGALTVEV